MQRFDSTKFIERKPFGKFWCYRTAVFFGKRSGSIAPSLLKWSPSETLVLSNRSVTPFPFIFDHWNKPILLVHAVARSPFFHNNRRATLLTNSLAPFRFLFFHRQKKPHSVNLSCGPVPFSLQQNMAHHVFKLFSGIFPCLPSPKKSTRQIANLGP